MALTLQVPASMSLPQGPSVSITGAPIVPFMALNTIGPWLSRRSLPTEVSVL